MNKGNLVGGIRLSGLDELLGSTGTETGDVMQIPVEKLVEFKNHPYRVIDDEDMHILVNSIRYQGILVPLVARKLDNGYYELISGHRRRHAAQLAGLKDVPVKVVEVDDDKAILMMVDSNIQREHLLISEKAKACKMKFDAMSHQGSRGGSSYDAIGKEYGDSGKTIQRFIKLADLSDELLNMIDSKKLGIMQGVNLASLSSQDQEKVYKAITGKPISVKQAREISNLSNTDSVTEEMIQKIVIGESSKEAEECFTIKINKSYFPESYSLADASAHILLLLDNHEAEVG